MYSQKAIELRRANLATWAQMEAILKKAKGENRNFNADEQTSWEKLDKEFEDRTKEIQAEEQRAEQVARHTQRGEELNRLDARHAGRDGDPIPEGLRGDGRHVITKESRAKASRVLRAFMAQPKDDWDDEVRAEIKRTHANLPKEIRALSQVTGAAGAFTIPQDFMPELDTALKQYSGIVEGCRVVQTDDGADLPWPTVDDTGNIGALLAEGSAAADTADPTFAQKILKTYQYTSKIIRVPIPLLADSAFDLERELFDMLGVRLGRILNNHGTLGTGTGQPRGLITALIADTTAVTTATAGVLVYNDIVKVEHAVDPAYRAQPGAAFMLHDLILQQIKQLVDGNSRPLFMPATDAPGTPNRIMGRPYFINQDMDSVLTTGSEIIVFGQLQKYIVRRGGQPIMMRLNERYAEFFQAAFVVFERLDANLVMGGTTAVRFLRT
jgi:HK97 family phage major capsid protein